MSMENPQCWSIGGKQTLLHSRESTPLELCTKIFSIGMTDLPKFQNLSCVMHTQPFDESATSSSAEAQLDEHVARAFLEINDPKKYS